MTPTMVESTIDRDDRATPAMALYKYAAGAGSAWQASEQGAVCGRGTRASASAARQTARSGQRTLATPYRLRGLPLRRAASIVLRLGCLLRQFPAGLELSAPLSRPMPLYALRLTPGPTSRTCWAAANLSTIRYTYCHRTFSKARSVKSWVESTLKTYFLNLPDTWWGQPMMT